MRWGPMTSLGALENLFVPSLAYPRHTVPSLGFCWVLMWNWLKSDRIFAHINSQQLMENMCPNKPNWQDTQCRWEEVSGYLSHLQGWTGRARSVFPSKTGKAHALGKWSPMGISDIYCGPSSLVVIVNCSYPTWPWHIISFLISLFYLLSQHRNFLGIRGRLREEEVE